MIFETKDSGKRAELAGGMVRDTEDGKTDYALVYDGPMLERWAQLLTRGAVKYMQRNWMLALVEDDAAKRRATKRRFLRSAARHFAQWMSGARDEDHGAAVFFNINCYEAMLETDDPSRRAACRARILELGVGEKD